MELLEYLKAERGRTNAVAKTVGMSPAYLSQIANGTRPCPHKRAPAIEEACGYHVTRQELCRDDWHETWPERNGNSSGNSTADGAIHNHQRHPPRPLISGDAMPTRTFSRRPSSATETSPTPAKPQGPHAHNSGGQHGLPDQGHPGSALVTLENEILRVAAQAAEAACSKQDLQPTAAALAVIDAYHAARERLGMGKSQAPQP